MTEKQLKDHMVNHPVIWVLSTLLIGFVAGIKVMDFLQNSQGMVPTTAAEHQQFKDKIKKLNDQAIELNNDADRFNVDLQKKDASVNRLQKANQILRDELEKQTTGFHINTKKSQNALTTSQTNEKKLQHTVDLYAKNIDELKQRNQQLIKNFKNEKIKLNQTITSLQKNIKKYTHYSTLEPPEVIEKSKRIEQNTVYNYFNGSVKLVLDRIFNDTPCLRTNLNTYCKDIRIGKNLYFNFQSHPYGFQVDSVNKNTIDITLLKFKSLKD